MKKVFTDYGFQEGVDYSPVLGNNTGKRGKPRKDYLLKLDVAKEVCMIGNTPAGRETRRYFIQMEKAAREMAGTMGPVDIVQRPCSQPWRLSGIPRLTFRTFTCDPTLHTRVLFNFNGQQLRTIVIEGEPWFVAHDACRILHLCTVKGTTHHLRKLDKDEKRFITPHQLRVERGGKLTAINESGLYKLIMRSDKAEAIAFQNWVPSVSKTGKFTPAFLRL